MNPLKFPEATHTLAKNQPGYRVLPVRLTPIDTENGVNEYTSKYELSDLELAQINLTRSFFFTQTGNCFHPICPEVANRWRYLPIEYLGNTAWVPLDNGEKEIIVGASAVLLLSAILSRFPELKADSIYFFEKPVMGIDEGGNIVGL